MQSYENNGKSELYGGFYLTPYQCFIFQGNTHVKKASPYLTLPSSFALQSSRITAQMPQDEKSLQKNYVFIIFYLLNL
jgi:hypothetical protein